MEWRSVKEILQSRRAVQNKNKYFNEKLNAIILLSKNDIFRKILKIFKETKLISLVARLQRNALIDPFCQYTVSR